MEQHDINIDAVLQLPYPTKDALPFVVTIEACPPSVLAAAMRQIGEFDFHVQPPVDLPDADRRPGVSGRAGSAAERAARRITVAEATARVGGCRHRRSGLEREPGAGVRHARGRAAGSTSGCASAPCSTGRPTACNSTCAARVSAGDNYVERSFRAVAEAEGTEFPSLSLEVRSDIPVQGGLGSSAAATVAGLLLYERLAGPREGRDLLTLATALDEHADNVAAALLGGLVTTCVADDGRVIARAVPWPDRIRFVVASPAVQLATSDSRRVLPDVVPRADAVFNLQRALLLVQALRARRLRGRPRSACAIAGTSRSARPSCRGSRNCWRSSIRASSASA